MKNKKYNNKRGFTLLEILLVIALIGVLSSIVLVAINPSRQLAEARNTERLDDITKINQALEDYFVTNRAYPTGITSIYQNICPPSGGSNCIDLSVLVPNYISSIPTDPSGGNYQIAINPSNGQISFRAPNSEIGNSISVNEIPATITFAQKAGGGPGAYIYDTSVVSLVDGSSIVTGVYQSPIILGAGDTNQTSLNVGSGLTAMFIAKYNANGSLAWAKKAAETGTIEVPKIKVLADGNIVIAGDFFQVANFGETGQVALISSTNAANDLADYSSFIAKYDNIGNLIWAKNVKSGSYPFPAYNNSTGIDILSDGSSIMTGVFVGPNARFADGEANQTTLTSGPGNSSLFIARYNTNGSLAWVKKVNNALGSWYGGNTISTNSDGSSIVTGSFNNTAIFGEGEANQTSLTTSGDPNVFIAKYNTNGTLAWVKGVGDTNLQYGMGVDTNSDGSSIITGTFYGTVVFGQGETNQTTFVTAETYYSDVYIAKYNANGTLAWAKKAGGPGFDYAYRMSSFTDGSFLVMGEYDILPGTIFGQGEPNQTTLPPATRENGDPFIAKYNANGTLAWVKNLDLFPENISNINTFIDNSYVMTGAFEGEVTFGLGDPGATTLNPTGTADMFIVKYDQDGILSTLTD